MNSNVPLSPDWKQITVSLHQRYGSDDKLVDELSRQGVLIDRVNITRLRNGVWREPKRFEICAALLNLHGELP